MKQVFLFAPGSGSSMPAMLILAFTMFIALYFLWAPRNIRYELTPGKLRIRGDVFYGRSIPIGELVLGNARIVDLSTNRELTPILRTNGTGLPGYKGGWFELSNGEKALAFIGNIHQVVYIPVKSGYSLLLSTPDPPALLAGLRND